jgi:23S rRNA pseudouridine1911/1915/1917 synthase
VTRPVVPQWQITDAEEEIRLDKFLAGAERLGSRKRVADALERGKVFLNDVELGLKDASRRLKVNDVVHVWMDRPGSATRRPGPFALGPLQILFEDDALLVVDKPAGLLSVPLPVREAAPSVYSQLENHLRSHRHRRPFIVHRIDRDTSGLVLFAKTQRAQQTLKEQFRRREPERVYLAVVYGAPSPASGIWRDVLAWDDALLIQKETHPGDPRGSEAIAEYRVVESFARTSLIEVRLRTGKRNQIRLQARLRGHTLVGEQRYTYGPPDMRPIMFPRQALHAHRLSFRHPVDERELGFLSPLPPDLTDLLERLRAEHGHARRTRPV